MSQTGVHATVAYPFARTVGCSCGWCRRDVDPSILDELAEQHLRQVGAVGVTRAEP